MADLIILLFVLSVLFLPIVTILWIVQAIRKKQTKRWRLIFLIDLAVIISSFVAIMFLPCNHEWNEATCTLPKTCSICEEVEGEALGHIWTDATCSDPKTCSVCGETDGEPIAHTPGDWVVGEANIGAGYYRRVRLCTVCKAEADSEIAFLASLHEDGHFLFSPKEFARRLDTMYGVLDYELTTSIKVLDDNTLACGIMDADEVVGAILFNNDLKEMDGDDIDERNLSSMMVYYYTDDISDVVPSMLGIMIACDPKLEQSSASTLGKAVVDASLKNDYYEHHGIRYALTIVNNQYLFVVSVLEKS